MINTKVVKKKWKMIKSEKKWEDLWQSNAMSFEYTSITSATCEKWAQVESSVIKLNKRESSGFKVDSSAIKWNQVLGVSIQVWNTAPSQCSCLQLFGWIWLLIHCTYRWTKILTKQILANLDTKISSLNRYIYIYILLYIEDSKWHPVKIISSPSTSKPYQISISCCRMSQLTRPSTNRSSTASSKLRND